jgi:hypothetical protein
MACLRQGALAAGIGTAVGFLTSIGEPARFELGSILGSTLAEALVLQAEAVSSRGGDGARE